LSSAAGKARRGVGTRGRAQERNLPWRPAMKSGTGKPGPEASSGKIRGTQDSSAFGDYCRALDEPVLPDDAQHAPPSRAEKSFQLSHLLIGPSRARSPEEEACADVGAALRSPLRPESGGALRSPAAGGQSSYMHRMPVPSLRESDSLPQLSSGPGPFRDTARSNSATRLVGSQPGTPAGRPVRRLIRAER
jgi:hypothetical protein